MTQEAEKLKTDLDRLSIQERAQLASYLIRSLDDGRTDEMAADQFNDELRRRNQDIESGRDPGEPAEDVMRDIRKKHL